MRTFNVGRIRELLLLDESFHLPRGFSIERYLGNAWHLIPEPDPIRTSIVRFSPLVARNVAEVVWHKTQRLVPGDDGTLEFHVRVAGLRRNLVVDPGLWRSGRSAQAAGPAATHRRARTAAGRICIMATPEPERRQPCGLSRFSSFRHRGDMFFSFDGLDGVGKTTQMDLFVEWLRAAGHDVVRCRDPGSTPLGEAIREILLGHEFAISRASEMLLFMAARAQLVEEVIRPALDAGKTVVSDRFLLANVVYQGHAGGLDVADDLANRPGGHRRHDARAGISCSTCRRKRPPVESIANSTAWKTKVMNFRPDCGPDFWPKPPPTQGGSWSSMPRDRSMPYNQTFAPRPTACWKVGRRVDGRKNSRMAWQGIEGHDPVVAKFRRALARNRLASTFLFVGPSGIGKRTFAEKLAQTLLCPELAASEMAPCGVCTSCRQVLAHTHPDLYFHRKTGRQELDSAGGVRGRGCAADARGFVPRHRAQALHGRA